MTHDVTIKNLLFSEELKTTTKAKDVFQFAKGLAKDELGVQSIGTVCTDVAPAMLGNKSGFSALLKQEIPYLQGTHCFLHRPALPSKTLPVLKEDLIELRSNRAVEMQFEGKPWKSIGARLWLCFQDL